MSFFFPSARPADFHMPFTRKKKKGKRLVLEVPACSSSLYSCSLSRQIRRVRLVDSQ